jgi:ABC-type glycerol-3-phosphate transport system permease component
VNVTSAGNPAVAGRQPRAPARRRHRWQVRRSVLSAVLFVLALSTTYPVVFALFSALKSAAQYARSSLGVPTSPTLANFTAVWSQVDVGRLALNSLIVVCAAVAVIVLVSMPAGWALASMRFPLRRVTLLGVIGMMMLPAGVLMIPVFTVVKDLGLVNNRLGLILVYASLHAPFATYLMTATMRDIPQEVVQAAEVDGCGPLGTLVKIVLPLTRPTVLTIITLTFLWLWNELLFALIILQNAGQRTLIVGIAALQNEFSTPPTLLAAGMVFAMLPALAVFVFFQRRLTVGLTAGAVR